MDIYEKNDAFRQPSRIHFMPYEQHQAAAVLLPCRIYDKFKPNYNKDEAVILYSSGTTGSAKGVILTHYAINTNADAIITNMQATSEDCIYIVRTMSHASTLTGEILVALKTKMRMVVAPEIALPRACLTNIERFKVTFIGLNPALLATYTTELIRSAYDVSALRAIYVGGSILDADVYMSAKKAFDGKPIYNVYGLTEAGPRVTSAGRPLQGVSVAIIDENGNIAQYGAKGIVHIKTPSCFSGYVSGERSLLPLYEDWLNSGDVGYVDAEGYLHIVDRMDDVIIIDAHKIYPTQVEAVINMYPDIKECIVKPFNCDGLVAGLRCEYVSNNADGTDISAMVRKWCLTQLLPYEVPKQFVLVSEILRTPKGSVIRK